MKLRILAAIVVVCLTLCPTAFAQRPDFRIIGPGGGGAMFIRWSALMIQTRSSSLAT